MQQYKKIYLLLLIMVQTLRIHGASENLSNLPPNNTQTTWSTNYGNGTPNAEYDFIIVGAGPAGCVLANRLTETDDFTVLLIEAGRPEIPMFTDVPMGAPLLQESEFNWGYVTEPQERACLAMDDFRCNWPHGRGVGGSSIINYMIYTRGNRRDFDKWAELGNVGWAYSDVLPYFKKSEKALFDDSYQNIDKEYHGVDGPLNVEWIPFKSVVSDAFLRSAVDAGYASVDCNALEQIGVSRIQQTTNKGWRLTAAKAFLEPVISRPNLHVVTHTRAIKLNFNEQHNRVESVDVLNKKQKLRVKARKEIILSAGAFESPKLLMLSGIGPAEHLRELHIEVVRDLPVGQTLYEHLAVFGPVFTMDYKSDGLINNDAVIKPENIGNFFNGKGPFTSTGVESLLYMKTNNSISIDSGYPDIELIQSFTTLSFDISQNTRKGVRLSDEVYDSVFKPLEQRRSFQYLPMLLHPRSSGYLKLKSTNPFHHPLFYPNFFADSRDLDTIVEGIREAIRLTSLKAFQKLGVKLYEAKIPGCESHEFNTDDYWKCYAMHLSATLHHQVGTCKMGSISDATTVIDPNALVHGFDNLRVADVGIIPLPPSGHTTAFSYMIGERVADLIKFKWNMSMDESNETKSLNLERKKRHFDWQKVDDSNRAEEKELNGQINFVPVDLIEETTVYNHHSNENQTSPNTGDVGAILWGKRHEQEQVTTEPNPTTLSAAVRTEPAIERIVNTAPSVREDMIKTIILGKDQHYGKGRAKAKYITMEFAKINSTEYDTESSIDDKQSQRNR